MIPSLCVMRNLWWVLTIIRNLQITKCLRFSSFVLYCAQTITGVQALYIYALPEDRLLGHYGSFGFSRLAKEDEQFVYARVKPAYDDGCIFMYQIL